MRIFSGIQPTGGKHLGNYLGAIRHYVAGQGRGESIHRIVDLHAISLSRTNRGISPEPSMTPRRLLCAAGLDPERCILFRQSDVINRPRKKCWN